jgi:hypothetical protein
MSSLVRGAYSLDTVPDDVRLMTVADQILHFDVLYAGEMAGTGLNALQSSDLGKIKNHWECRAPIRIGPKPEDEWAAIFGMEADNTFSVPSDVAGSTSLSGSSDSSSIPVSSDIGSEGKSTSLNSSKDRASVASSVSGGGATTNFDAVSSIGAVPSVRSSQEGIILAPPQGTPAPAVFLVKIRNRSSPAFSAIKSFTIALLTPITVGQLLDALKARRVESFRFRKVGCALFGCRDFMYVLPSVL